MSARPALLVLHRRVALVLAPLLFLQALTGTVLLLRDAQFRITGLQSEPGRVSLPLSALVRAAEAGGTGSRATRVFLPSDPRDPAFVQIAGEGAAYAAVDPGTGRVLARGSLWHFPVEAALQWHYRLNAGVPGMVVVLLNGIGLFALAVTGLAYWWPGTRRWKASLAIRAAAPARARLRQWHRSIGVVLAPVVLMSALTGVLLVGPDLAASGAPAGAAPPPPGAAQLDRALTKARAAQPGATIRDVRLPPADRIDVNFRAPRRNSQAIDLVSVRLSDGAVLKVLPAERNAALWVPVLPWHSGTALGLAGKAILLAEGLALMILAASGPLMWWQTRRPRRRKS